MAWALFGPSRLWDLKSQSPYPYQLVKYSPSEIVFNLNAGERDLSLLWADFTDGFWDLEINGQKSQFMTDAPASLRAFQIISESGNNTIRMVYRSPLSRFWR
jgi:hypothetical protein